MSSCPKCRTRSHVLRSEDTPAGTRRRRECNEPSCKFRWTTIEHKQEGMPTIERPEGRLNVGWTQMYGQDRTDGRVPRPQADAEAIRAAMAVDRRKREIREAQRKRDADDGDEVGSSYRDDGFDAAPRRLSREALRRELMNFNLGGHDDDWEA